MLYLKGLINKFLKWIDPITTGVERLCEKHAKQKKPKYYLKDSENCIECLNNVIEFKRKKK